MTMLLDYDPTPSEDVAERLAQFRIDIELWLERHVDSVRALGPTETIRCIVGGRHFAGYECFDCDFTGEAGDIHLVTVSACFANQLADPDAQVVDAVSALTLLGMLLDRIGIRPILSPS
jgi:hypothetical protein